MHISFNIFNLFSPKFPIECPRCNGYGIIATNVSVFESIANHDTEICPTCKGELTLDQKQWYEWRSQHQKRKNK